MSNALGPLPDPPNPEIEIRDALLEDAANMMERLTKLMRSKTILKREAPRVFGVEGLGMRDDEYGMLQKSSYDAQEGPGPGAPVRVIRTLRIAERYLGAIRGVLGSLNVEDDDAEGVEGPPNPFGRMPPRAMRRGHGAFQGDPQHQMVAMFDDVAGAQRVQALTIALRNAIQIGDQALVAQIRAQLGAPVVPDVPPVLAPPATEADDTLDIEHEDDIPPPSVSGIASLVAMKR